MGLFINDQKHPEVFRNTDIKNEQNQEIHRKDFLNELLQIQQNTNLSLNHSLDELKLHNQREKELHSVKWKELDEQLNDFRQRNSEHHHVEIQIMEQLKNVEEKSRLIHTLIEKETRLKQDIMNQMEIQSKTRHEMAKRIDHYEALTQQLSQQIEEQHMKITEKMKKHEEYQTVLLTRLDKQEKLYQQLSEQINIQTNLEKEVSEKIAHQEDYHTEILTRLDKQEALAEKLTIQINHIRSILFERTNFLANKIEKGYKLTSSYVYKLITGSDQPLTFYSFKNKQEENQKQEE